MVIKNFMSEDHQFQKLCNNIFALNARIRFVGIIDRMGKLVAGGMRVGIRSMEEDSAKLYLDFALRSEMRKDFDAEFGKTIYSFSQRQKIKLASFPLDDNHILRLSLERKEPHNEIIEKVLKIISTMSKESQTVK
jgi:hypothetical protein